MMKYKRTDMDVGDYVKLNLCNGWFKVDFIYREGFDVVDNFGYKCTLLQFEDISDLKLASEMNHAF